MAGRSKSRDRSRSPAIDADHSWFDMEEDEEAHEDDPTWSDVEEEVLQDEAVSLLRLIWGVRCTTRLPSYFSLSVVYFLHSCFINWLCQTAWQQYFGGGSPCRGSC